MWVFLLASELQVQQEENAQPFPMDYGDHRSVPYQQWGENSHSGGLGG